MSYEPIAAGGFIRFMIERIEVELEEQRRAALDLIAARCAEALRAVERQTQSRWNLTAADLRGPSNDPLARKSPGVRTF